MAATERTTKQVVDDTKAHLGELVSAHVELAKAELKETQQDLLAGIGPLAVGGVLALYLLGFFGVTAAKVLEIWLVEWAAWLIVSGAMLLLVGLLVLIGVSKLGGAKESERVAAASVQDTVRWAKARTGKVGR